MEAGVERDAPAVLAEHFPRRRGRVVRTEHLGVHAVRQVQRLAIGKACSDVADDLDGLPGHEPGVPVAEALERRAQTVHRAAPSHQAQPHSALRPQIGHVENEPCPLQATEQDCGEAEEQRRALDQEVVGRIEPDSAGDRRR